MLKKIPQKGTIIVDLEVGDGITVEESGTLIMAVINLLKITGRVLTEASVAQTAE